MAPTLDPAIVEALSLDAAVTTIASHGGSGFTSTAKITTQMDGAEKLYFIKIGSGKAAEVMFAGEHASLNAIHSIVPSLCPTSHAHGALSSGQGFFIATDFLHLGARLATHPSLGSSSLSLASKLAKLHSTPAPIPDGFQALQFGFPVPTCCGSTEQPNDYSHSWSHFFANSRLRAMLASCEKKHGRDTKLRDLVEKTAMVIVPRLLGDEHLNPGNGITPVLVHGDLWSGNKGVGSIGKGPVEEVIFDPSACYGHSEYDLGIMRMFGGFGEKFFDEYHALKPMDEPVEEYADRGKLYEIYHYFNHYVIFGGGYRSTAVDLMRELDEKYGMGNGDSG